MIDSIPWKIQFVDYGDDRNDGFKNVRAASRTISKTLHMVELGQDPVLN